MCYQERNIVVLASATRFPSPGSSRVMSKDIELRHILPNGRQNSCNSDNMSGSGSFHSSPPHDLSTDIVGGVAPVYSTVPEAQAEHSRYSSRQVKNSHGIVQNEYTSPVNVDPPNTYDLIPENTKRQTDRSSPGVAPLMAENVLYGTPVDEQLKHRTLTMEKAKSEKHNDMRFSGSVSSPMLKEPADDSVFCTGKHCGVCLILVLVFVVAVLAVAALVLVLSVMFHIYPVCDCPSGKLSLSLSLSLPLSLSFITVSLSLSAITVYAFHSLLHCTCDEFPWDKEHTFCCSVVNTWNCTTLHACRPSVHVLVPARFVSFFVSGYRWDRRICSQY